MTGQIVLVLSEAVRVIVIEKHEHEVKSSIFAEPLRISDLKRKIATRSLPDLPVCVRTRTGRKLA